MMDFGKFFEAFKDGRISIEIDDSLEFKALCATLEENGFHVYREAEWRGTLYEYAQDRSDKWERIALGGYNEITATIRDCPINISAADLPWLSPPIDDFLSILEERSAKNDP